MSYLALARKWRPQSFDDVIGQQAVTRTLKNALKTGRIAQAFVFAGPRGCGKTTTARILARALNCAQGPTAEPCGACEACVEIAEGRDIDVLEIDAATHTGVDNVREVIIEGLSIAPVRSRYKIFLIDEVHMLSASSFNALLKSIEEPPRHVVFMMATTELHRIPDTVLSRAQIYEFRTIPAKIIVERLRHIAGAEGIDIPDAALALLARAGEGSMRDSLSALDQVRAFAGDAITVDDVVGVLGLIGRDIVLDMLEAVADENAQAAFALVEKAIERGDDLRLLCRELARATRDLLLISVDRARIEDPEVAAEGERERLTALVERSSREDLLRAFDLLTKAQEEIRTSEQPRYNMEMALLRLMHLRKLVPLTELLAGGAVGARGASGGRREAGSMAARPAPDVARPGALPSRAAAAAASRHAAGVPGVVPRHGPSAARGRPAVEDASGAAGPMIASGGRAAAGAAAGPDVRERDGEAAGAESLEPEALKNALLSQIKSSKVFFYNTVVAQAYRVEVTPSGIVFTFLPNQKVPRQQCEETKGWIEAVAQKIAGRRIPVVVEVAESVPVQPPASATGGGAGQGAGSGSERLRDEVMADPAVQALFEIFPVEKTRIEEMEP
jgi:DNA polymerase-3 subunit gamma/tau